RSAIGTGWRRLDLSGEDMALSGEVVITLELLPVSGDSIRGIAYGIRLGGSGKGFDRRSTFDDWAQMPHRYSINVTALVPKDRPKEVVEDPEPFVRSVDAYRWSSAVQDSFSIAFGLPEAFDPQHPGGYPTVYLLDANVYFDDVVQAFRKEARKGRMPPVIVVGVGYRDVGAMDTLRERDYVYPAHDSMRMSGGGERFLRFLTDELVPFVDQRFPGGNTQRVLAGHSLGGYFALYAWRQGLVDGRMPFNAFVAASPSFELTRAFAHMPEVPRDAFQQHPCRLFITTGEGERDVQAMEQIERAEHLAAGGLTLIEKHYPKADHMATALPSFVDGLGAVLGPVPK
ncbi:MAG TPA: alpha/beta hydrolase-fold protein, partial [Flavobacteriales bacterium]|nr:alpha/beta hydrolase-fold protein [Flavobacteriales bacterium]